MTGSPSSSSANCRQEVRCLHYFCVPAILPTAHNGANHDMLNMLNRAQTVMAVQCICSGTNFCICLLHGFACRPLPDNLLSAHMQPDK